MDSISYGSLKHGYPSIKDDLNSCKELKVKYKILLDTLMLRANLKRHSM